ncbi:MULTISPECIES: hypothetical protein [Halomonadaceae]|uniref:hypothetical protein n=1 Tax=Halomonas TaxID=2745 RepID=UPI0018A79B5B|nr:hypothetical protein [Halomonas sp. 328]MBF8222472.1 hypothetical protein [Halomonas sp. 328]
MSPQDTLEMATFLFNLLGLVICLLGLTLARRRRLLGYGIAVTGFVIAAAPMLAQLFPLT